MPDAVWQTGWFSGRFSVRTLPSDCVKDCSSQGSADEAVSYWVKELAFDGPPWLFREYLSGYGAWDAMSLASHERNRERVLWLWACSCREDPTYRDLYLSK